MLSNKWLLFIAGFMCFANGFVDFHLKEPLSPIFFITRFAIFSLVMLFSTSINYKMFNKKHFLITSIFLAIINTTNLSFGLISENNQMANLGALCINYFLATILYCPGPKYLIAPLLTPWLTLLILTMTGVNSVDANLSKETIFILGFVTFANIFFYSISASLKNIIETLNKKISQMKDESKELVDENHQLIRILCHDLSNSITVVDIAVKLIEKVELEDEIMGARLHKNMGRIARAMDNQKDIINHVRDKKALDSGKREINLTPVSLLVVFERAQFTFEKQLQERNINLVLNFQGKIVPYVMAELVSLSNNVINNIISNAIKFSHDNSQIIVSTWEDNNHLFMTIEDFGIGMDESLVKNVFSSSKKTSRPGVRGEKGTGFGMPLVKSYMGKYGGDIFVESKVNKGTRFILKFQTKVQEGELKLVA